VGLNPAVFWMVVTMLAITCTLKTERIKVAKWGTQNKKIEK
jgi:hypothetical protein